MTGGPVSTTTKPTGPRAGGLKHGEIQALRAAAVLGVVVYHLWPARLTGGFAGVDVFFVISGFLITAHLIRELTSTGSLRLGRFYARRARRLLPAALLVLTTSAVVTWLIVPERSWPQFFREIIGSTLYVQNWVLSADSVDYLAQNNAPSPVQHYWSLSVEEQFYIVWPLLLVATWAVLRHLRRRGDDDRSPDPRWLALPLAVLGVVSLVWSIHLTAVDPGPAYFITPTRVWEFAAGGLMAVFYRRREGASVIRSSASWLGFVGIAATFLLFDHSTPFPSYTALLPVVSTLLVLWAGDPSDRWSPRVAFGNGAVQYVGDVSYSLYLWHWPVIVFTGIVAAAPLDALQKVGLFAVSLALAALSKKYVEDPARSWKTLGRAKGRWTLVATVVAMVPVLVVSAGLTADLSARQSAYQRTLEDVASGGVACLGADAIADPGCTNPALGDTLFPDTTNAGGDDVNTPDCWSRNGEDELKVCTERPVGEPTLQVALVGDSHSNQYLSTMKYLAESEGWQVDVMGKTGCMWTDATQVNSERWLANCQSWKSALDERLATGKRYDVVITSSSAASEVAAAPGESVEQTTVDGLVGAWAPVTDRGTKVVAIRDNPAARDDYLECIEQDPATANERCSLSEDDAFAAFDGQPESAERLEGADLVDLTDYFCHDGSCPVVVGNVIVNRDPSHLTSTYARTLGPVLHEKIMTTLARS